MRASFKSSAIVALTALALVTSSFAANAGQWHGGGGGGHWGGGGAHWSGGHGGWGHGGWGYGALGAGLILGIAGAAIASQSCYANQPVYDGYGNVVGYRTVNTCY